MRGTGLFALSLLVSLPAWAGAANEARRGAFEATFQESNPLSSIGVLESRAKIIRKHVKPYALSKETFSVFVPDSYDGKKLHGLLVFVNAGKSGRCPKQYHSVLKKHAFIWVGANNSGNDRSPRNARLGMALDAVHNLKKQYQIDPDRVYASGFSGGGTMCSILMYFFPDVFTGGLPMCAPGCYYDNAMCDKFFMMGKPKPEQYKLIADRSRFAVMSHAKDFNLKSAQSATERLKRDGLPARLFRGPEAHRIANAQMLDEALTFLDGCAREKAKKVYEKALADQKRRKVDMALNGYEAAARQGGDEPWAKEAAAKAKALRERYASLVQAIEQDFEAKRYGPGSMKIRQLEREWPSRSVAKVKEFKAMIEEIRRKALSGR